MIRDDPLTFLGQEDWLSQTQDNPFLKKVEKEHFTQKLSSNLYMYTGVVGFSFKSEYLRNKLGTN